MKESLLHFIWRFQLLKNLPLKTTEGKSIEILRRGSWNKIDSGPDFSMAQIKFNHQIWAGSIEIHVLSSDWELHKHSLDEAYDNVILHVVYEHNKDIPLLKSRNVPTLELKSYILDEVLQNYQNLIKTHQNFIPCEKSIHLIQKEKLEFWLNRLVIERLERKMNTLVLEFNKNNKNWEQLLFKKLAYAFGLKINSEAFSFWSDSFDFKIISKIQHNSNYVHALFLGQAGFLHGNFEDSYIQKLQKDYSFLQTKYQLRAINPVVFKFSRLRPISFPTIRLMQLASIYSHYQNLFSFLMGTQKIERIFSVFQDLNYPDFWENHYRLEKESKTNTKKSISTNIVERIIINVIIPIKFIYSKLHTNTEFSDELFDWLLELPAEQNSIIQSYSQLGLKAKNAFESQAFLELNKHFCIEKKCLNCAIGLQILKND